MVNRSQIIAVMTRLGWQQITDSEVLTTRYAQSQHERFPGLYWNKGNQWAIVPPEGIPDYADRYHDLLEMMAIAHRMSVSDIRRIFEAEPGPDDDSQIALHIHHLQLNERGRDRLIAALIEGRSSIVFGSQETGFYGVTIVIQ